MKIKLSVLTIAISVLTIALNIDAVLTNHRTLARLNQMQPRPSTTQVEVKVKKIETWLTDGTEEGTTLWLPGVSKWPNDVVSFNTENLYPFHSQISQ